MIVCFTTYLVNQKATHETERFGFDMSDEEAAKWITKHLDGIEQMVQGWTYVHRDGNTLTYGNGYLQVRMDYRIR